MTDGEIDTLRELERDARPGPLTAQAVFDALDELGGTADIVAARLAAEGYRGSHQCDTCPIAVYLSRVFECRVEVCSDWVAVGGVSIEPPLAIVKFVDRFDDEEFPNLKVED